MKARPGLILLLVVVAGGGLWWGTRFRGRDAPTGTREGSRVLARSRVSDDPQSRGAREEQKNAELLLSLAKQFSSSPSAEQVAQALRGANSADERRAALGQLLSHHIDRGEAIRLLEDVLTDESLKVRVRAAELLYTLGSAAGRQTLLEVLRHGTVPDPQTLSESVAAAGVLSKFRESIPGELLQEVYERHSHPALLSIMAMQGDSRYLPFLIDAVRDEEIVGNIINLGVLADQRSYSAVKRIFDSSRDESARIAAAWSMFRTGADRAALDYVRERAGLGITTPASVEKNITESVGEARSVIYVTRDETVRDFLRQAVAAPAADVSSAALASLFYVQQDYAFVDALLKSYFADGRIAGGADHNLIWKISALRNVPEIEAAARARNDDAYQRYFVRFKARPAEGWIWSYLRKLPMR